MSYSTCPEYEFFTGIEIKLYIGGDREKSFIISKLGEHFSSITITEGSVSGDQQITIPDGNHLSNGSVDLYDEDNSIFNSLLVSKTSEGNALMNTIDITLNTYTGKREYLNCRVNKWSCSFSGGIPRIKLDWQGFPSDSQPAISKPTQSSFDVKKATDLLVNQGIANFKDFKNYINQIFTDSYSFVYSTTREYTESGFKDITDDGGMLVFTQDSTSSKQGYIFIPESCKTKESSSGKAFPFQVPATMETNSFLSVILSEFCKTAKITLTKGEEKDFLGLGYLIKGNKIFLYSYIDTSNMTIPQPSGTAEILNSTVFVYNSSLRQGEDFTTPGGVKKVFTIVDEGFGTTFDMDKIIVANLKNQANASNPNGNFVMTSRGLITVPEGVPQVLAQAIQNLAGLSLDQRLQVKMTVYNFIHFYCLGETPVYIIVYDHKGNVHPLSGRMRVGSYTYSLGEGGVIKADVTLLPLLKTAVEDYAKPVVGTLPNSSYNSNTDYPDNPTTLPGSFIRSGLTLNSAVDYYITTTPRDKTK